MDGWEKIGTPTNQEETFTPRLQNQPSRLPFNPWALWLVGCFAGVLAVAIVASMNLRRLPDNANTRHKTYGSIIAMAVASALLLFLVPVDWFSNRYVTYALRAVAMIGGSYIARAQRGPAISRGDHLSMWKALGPIIAGIVGYSIIVIGVAVSRGVQFG